MDACLRRRSNGFRTRGADGLCGQMWAFGVGANVNVPIFDASAPSCSVSCG